MLQISSTLFSESILDAIPQIAWTAASDGTCTYVNKAWCEFTGDAWGEDASHGWVNALHPEDQERVLSAWLQASASERTFTDEFRLRTAQGDYRWMLTRASAEVHDGIVSGWCGTCTDIHDRVIAEESLRRSERRIQTILESIPQVIWTSEPGGVVDYVSQRWEAVFGGKSHDILGTQWMDLVHADDIEDALRRWRACLTSGQPLESKYRIRMPDGTYHWTLFQAVAEKDDTGRVLRWYGSCADIHDQVLADQKLQQAGARLRRTIDHIPQMIWSTLPDGYHDYFSPSWYEFTGAIEGSTEGDGWSGMFHPDDQERAWALWRECLTTGEPYEIQYRLRHRSGDHRWVLSRAVPERDEHGAILRWHGTCTDIHRQVSAETAKRESEALHRSILDASADCIKMISLNGTVEVMNAPGVCALELDDFEAIRGKDWASLWPAASQDVVARSVRDAGCGQTARFTGFCPTAKGTPKWWDVVVSPMLGDDGNIVRLLAISRDITAHRKTSEQLRWASEHDALTSLPNRRAFQAHLQAATIRAMASGEPLGLLLIDLDHFKHVNDTLGHAAGDHVLKTFAHRLKTAVGTGDFVARLGGDEFAVVMHDIGDGGDLLLAGESIAKRFGAPMDFGGRALSAGASIGGALFPEDGQSAHELFNNADTALYALKGSGRGGTGLFHSHMRAEAQKVASQLSLARVFVDEKSVIPHFQQKVDLKTGQLRGFEALLRMKHSSRGLLLPDTVAEAFKDYELASKIGKLMQESVFAEMQTWLKLGLDFGSVAINAAPAEFLRDDFAERFLGRLEKYDVPARFLEVEVTEHVFFERGAEYVSRALKLLNEAGVRIALDDFGTGYSSLSHLRDFPVDVVKIDQSFVAKMLHEPEIAAIVSAVISLAGSLSIEVVAEGVETAAQRDFLQRGGCTFGQGYFFGRAVDAIEVPLLIPPRA